MLSLTGPRLTVPVVDHALRSVQATTGSGYGAKTRPRIPTVASCHYRDNAWTKPAQFAYSPTCCGFWVQDFYPSSKFSLHPSDCIELTCCGGLTFDPLSAYKQTKT